MNSHLIILFIVIPLAASLLSVLLINQPRLSRAVGVVSFGSMLVLALGLLVAITRQGGAVLVSQMGGWSAPYGISVVFDSLSGLMLAAASAVALGSYIHSFGSVQPRIERRYFHPLVQALIVGVNLSFLTGDLFNLFVSFEVMLMASYALMCLGTSRKQLTQAYKYVLLNLLASTVFVMAAGMTYGMMGTLNIADLSRMTWEAKAAGEAMPTGFTALAVLLLMVFGLKGAFFPLWFWLPDTYHTMPIALGGLFAGMLTKVGVYAVARTFPLVFAVPDPARELVLWVLGISAGVTMFLGVLGAVSQNSVRQILSVHVISQIGYMIFAIAVGITLTDATVGGMAVGAFALAGCVFFIIHNMVVKCSLFLCCGLMENYAGSDALDRLGGLLRKDGLLAILFFIAAMSLVGLPPLSGFFGKLTIIQAGWASEHWLLAVVGLATGVFTLLSMLKIWSYGFWSPTPEAMAEHRPPARAQFVSGYVGVGLLVAAALFLGLAAEPVYSVAYNAGRQLVDPTAYVQAVLGPEATAEMGIAETGRVAEWPGDPDVEAVAPERKSPLAMGGGR
ncbi:MAG: proton-conducting transporter membrane subunit [Phycisphaeraceae bacterium]